MSKQITKNTDSGQVPSQVFDAKKIVELLDCYFKENNEQASFASYVISKLDNNVENKANITPQLLQNIVDFADNIKTIKTAVDSKEYDFAIAKCNECIEEDNIFKVSYYSEKANAESLDAQYANAIETYKKTLRIDPDHLETKVNLITALCDLKHFDEALSYARDLVSKDETNAVYLVQLAAVQFNLGNFVEAEQNCRKVIELDENLHEAHNNLGSILIKTGRAQESISHIENAIRIAPDDSIYYITLGNAYLELDRPQEAASCFRMSIKLGNKSAEVYFGLGAVLDELEEYQEAIEPLSHALILQPKNKEANIFMGDALFELNQNARAIIYYKNVLKEDTDNPRANFMMGKALNNLNKFKEALLYLDKAIESFKTHIESDPQSENERCGLGFALFYKAIALKNLNDLEQAQNCLNDAYEQHSIAKELKSDHYPVYYGLAIILKEHGKNNEAIENFKIALDLNNKYSNAYKGLIELLTDLGRGDEAAFYTQKQISSKQGDSETVYALENNDLTSANSVANESLHPAEGEGLKLSGAIDE